MKTWTLKRGQKVVCVDPSCKTFCRFPLIKGRVYIVAGTFTCDCGSRQVSIETRPEVLNMCCGCSRSSVRRQTYYEWRFIPLEFLTNIISKPSQKKLPQKIQI